jgi:ankyrin repeat protein
MWFLKEDNVNRFFIIVLAGLIVVTFTAPGSVNPTTDSTSSKAFFKSARRGDLKGIMEMVKKGVDVNTVDKRGNTALILASEKGHGKIVEFLIQQGSDVNARNKHGRTALIAAGSTDVAHLLLAHGAEIEAKNNNGWTPLMHAAIYNNTDLIKFFVEKGADVNAKDRTGKTALMMLMDKGAREAIECLLENNADPNIKDKSSRTALMGAARKGRLIIAALLIEHGADVSVKDKFGKTARKIAKENQLDEMADFLRSPNAKALLSGTGQIRINEPFLQSLLDEEQVKNLLDYPEPVVKKIKVRSRGKEGNVTISGSVNNDRMFGCSVVVGMHESPSHAQLYFKTVNKQFKDVMKKTRFKAKRLGDNTAAFYRNEATVMLFFTVDHLFVQVSLMAPKDQLSKVSKIAKVVENRIEQPANYS